MFYTYIIKNKINNKVYTYKMLSEMFNLGITSIYRIIKNPNYFSEVK